MFFMAYSPQPTVAVEVITAAATRGSIKGKAGGRYAADLVLQLPARGRFRCFHSAFHWVAPSTWLTPLRAGMK
jgi:hypothetical protein